MIDDPGITPTAEAGTRRRILVVDDDPFMRECTARLLSDEGYEVQTANDGKAALDRLQNERWELLLTDFSMPGCPGEQLAVEAKRLSPGILVLLMSGLPRDRTAAVDGFLRKPFTATELAHALDACGPRRN